jgi:hypothetical protein
VPLIDPLQSQSGRRPYFVAKFNREHFVVPRQLPRDRHGDEVIDRRNALSELPESLPYLGEGHARAQVVITV